MGFFHLKIETKNTYVKEIENAGQESSGGAPLARSSGGEVLDICNMTNYSTYELPT
jgi:hypothetical protein